MMVDANVAGYLGTVFLPAGKQGGDFSVIQT
jgi:hypothetical protein